MVKEQVDSLGIVKLVVYLEFQEYGLWVGIVLLVEIGCDDSFLDWIVGYREDGEWLRFSYSDGFG